MDPATQQTIQTISEIANNFSVWLMPVIVAALSVIILLLLKDGLASIAKGIKFMMNPAFKEGDAIYLDGVRATIVKVGLFRTVFGLYNEHGEYCWRYVANERISMLRIEKIIRPIRQHEPENKSKI